MNDEKLQSPEEINAFLAGAQSVTLSISKYERHTWLARILKQTQYDQLKKKEKGIVRAYMIRVTGYSSSQLTALIRQYKTHKWIGCRHPNRHHFHRRYMHEDVLLLVKTDQHHDTLSGPLTKKLFERAFVVFKDLAYERLSTISVSHIYNLRKGVFYQRQRYQIDKTKRTPVSIGERRKPKSNGQPGYIRIDTVHQGDEDNKKGVYHINAVDEVTQFEVICSVEKISERYLIPVLEELLDAFPFVIIGFHSDNGSEYVNTIVAKLLNKLHIEFTKSRPRHSNDNALVESKNGSIVRKVLGYIHIPQRYAPMINAFNRDYWVPYLNYHRPCYFVEIKEDKKGKIKKSYPYKKIMTPYEKLKSLPNAQTYLKKEMTFEQLDQLAFKMTDLESAQQMQLAREKLFQQIFHSETCAPA